MTTAELQRRMQAAMKQGPTLATESRGLAKAQRAGITTRELMAHWARLMGRNASGP